MLELLKQPNIYLPALLAGVIAYLAYLKKRKDDKQDRYTIPIERKAAVEELLRLVDKTDGSGVVYAIYDHHDKMNDGFCLIDWENKGEYISDKICERIGRSRSDMGSSVKDLQKLCDPTTFATFRENVMSMMEGKFDYFEQPKLILHRNNSWVHYRVKVAKKGAYILSVFNETGSAEVGQKAG